MYCTLFGWPFSEIQRQRGRAVRVNGAEEQLRRPEPTGVENRLAQRFSRSVVKAEVIDRNQHQVVAALFKRHCAGREGIVDFARQFLAAFIARQGDRECGGNLDASRPGAERIILRKGQAHAQKQATGAEKDIERTGGHGMRSVEFLSHINPEPATKAVLPLSCHTNVRRFVITCFLKQKV